jgi:hypothetical protein
MKQAFLPTTATVFCLLFQSFIAPSAGQNLRETVSLRGGTPVSVTVNQHLDSDDLDRGNTILFLVDDAVIADNQIVIRKGERAEGFVRDLSKRDKKGRLLDKFQRLEVVVNRVKAVDGQYVFLYGKPYLKQSKGAKAPVQLHTELHLEAFVEQNVEITIR